MDQYAYARILSPAPSSIYKQDARTHRLLTSGTNQQLFYATALKWRWENGQREIENHLA